MYLKIEWNGKNEYMKHKKIKENNNNKPRSRSQEDARINALRPPPDRKFQKSIILNYPTNILDAANHTKATLSAPRGCLD